MIMATLNNEKRQNELLSYEVQFLKDNLAYLQNTINLLHEIEPDNLPEHLERLSDQIEAAFFHIEEIEQRDRES